MSNCAYWCELPADHAGPCVGMYLAIPGYPFLPCPICKGVEGCDHTTPERARATHPSFISQPSRS